MKILFNVKYELFLELLGKPKGSLFKGIAYFLYLSGNSLAAFIHFSPWTNLGNRLASALPRVMSGS